MDQFIFFLYYVLVLVTGIAMSAAFVGANRQSRRPRLFVLLMVLCGVLQLVVFCTMGEQMVWRLYPFICHLPVGITIGVLWRKKPTTVLAAVSTSYFCLQLSKWCEVIVEAIAHSEVAGQVARIIAMLVVCFIILRYLATYLAELFSKDNRSVLIFGCVPMVFYVFDYLTSVYTDIRVMQAKTTVELLSFFLCAVYLLFCLVYYREYEQKVQAEQKEQIIRFTLRQQEREIEKVKRSEQLTRMLRHDMRHILRSLSLCVENNDREKALALIDQYASIVEEAALFRFCENDTINYVLSDFAARCKENDVAFHHSIEFGRHIPDELLFATLLSNALENALNAQKSMPEGQRSIKLQLRTREDKLLLSVENPFKNRPVFADDLPMGQAPGHGYGTQSIRYMAERMGGRCMFSTEGKNFVLRVII